LLIQSRARFIKFLEKKNDLSIKFVIQKNLPWINISLLEICVDKIKIKLVNESDPTCVKVKLLQSVLEIGSLVLLDQKEITSLIDSSHAQKEFNLIFRRDLCKLMDLALNDILSAGVV
jgi:hypothetical protein